ncbi:MAG TPA: Uma2 family endonuclease [Gemmatimonadaceae bacterium]
MGRVHLSGIVGAEQIIRMVAPMQRWTAERVRALTDESRAWPRYELVDGELLVTPVPSPAHQIAVAAVLRALQTYIERVGIGASVLPSPADLELEPGTIVQPDVFVVPLAVGETLREWTTITSLLLAVEVLSPGSARRDRTTKRRFYMERADVAEYWVMDLDARVIERWRRGDERPAVVYATLEWQPDATREPLMLDVGELFRGVPVRS